MTSGGGLSGRGRYRVCAQCLPRCSMEARHGGGLGPGEGVWVGFGGISLILCLFFPSDLGPLLCFALLMCCGCVFVVLFRVICPRRCCLLPLRVLLLQFFMPVVMVMLMRMLMLLLPAALSS